MDRSRFAAFLRTELIQTEIGRMKSCSEAGIFHLRLAIESFDGMGHGTTTDDLTDFLEEAVEAQAVLQAATG